MEQSYKKHAMMDPIFHYVIAPLSLVTIVLSITQFITALLNDEFSLSSLILLLAAFLFFFIAMKVRFYGLKLQDRLIRTEENFRYYVLTGKRLDSRLTMKQLIALRFADDDEFPRLVEKALNENLSPDAIKRSVENWRADHHRV